MNVNCQTSSSSSLKIKLLENEFSIFEKVEFIILQYFVEPKLRIAYLLASEHQLWKEAMFENLIQDFKLHHTMVLDQMFCI